MHKPRAAALVVLAALTAAAPTSATADPTTHPERATVARGHLGPPAMSSMTVVRKCDRVITTTAVTDRAGHLLKRTRVVRFRDRRC